jgi:hypothetical protein
MSDPPTPVAQQRAAHEIEHRLRALIEIARIAEQRAVLHATLAQQHAAWWLGDWEQQKMMRLHELARILADPELHAVIRATPALRTLFSREPPPVPKRPRTPNHRRARAKPTPDAVCGPARPRSAA